MSTGGIHVVLGAEKPKSRNGSQRTIAMIHSLLYGRERLAEPSLSRQVYLLRLRVFRVDHFRILHVRIVVRTLRTLSTLRTLRTLSGVKLFRHRVRQALQLLGPLLDRRDILTLRGLAEIRNRRFD